MKLDRFQQFVEKMNEASTAAATAAITMQKNLKDLSLTNQRRKKDQSSTSTRIEDKTRQYNRQRQTDDEEMAQFDDEEMEGQFDDEEMAQFDDEEMEGQAQEEEEDF